MDLCSSWVKTNVLPSLTGPRLPPYQLRQRIQEFLLAQPDRSQIVADIGMDNWLLRQVAEPLPPNVQQGWMDISDARGLDTFQRAYERYFASGNPAHHALHDARVLRLGYLAVMCGDE